MRHRCVVLVHDSLAAAHGDPVSGGGRASATGSTREIRLGPNGAAQESNLPTDGLHRPAGFEDETDSSLGEGLSLLSGILSDGESPHRGAQLADSADQTVVGMLSGAISSRQLMSVQSRERRGRDRWRSTHRTYPSDGQLERPGSTRRSVRQYSRLRRRTKRRSH